MNKRNELRAKLHACHIQQQQQHQQQQQTRSGGPSAVNQIPKAKRPAAVAAISATVPKKAKVEHRFHHKQHHHQFGNHQNQQPTASCSSPSATSFSSSANALEQQRQQQQQSLLLVREAAECAASAVDDAAGEVVVEESGGGGGPLDQFLRNRTVSSVSTSDICSSPTQRSGGGTAEDDHQQQQAVTAPSGGADAWLCSADGRQIDDAIAELSLDKAVTHLSASTAAGAHSAEAVLRLIAVVSQCADLLTDAQIRQLFPALRAHRLRGIDAAEKLLLLLIKQRKQLDGDTDQLKQFPLSAFTRPPPTKIVDPTTTTTDDTTDGDAIEQQQNGRDGGAKNEGDKNGAEKGDDKDAIVLLTEERGQPKLTAADENRHRLAHKSADELLELLLSDDKMDEQQQHLVVAELLDKRPDLVDVHATNFDAQMHALFACRLSVARALVAHQLAHCAAAAVIKRSVTFLLNSFNPSFCPSLVVTFVAKVCGAPAEDTKVGLVLNGEQCFVLALYVLEDIDQQFTPDMKEMAFNALDSVRLFGSVLANSLNCQMPSTPRGPSSADLLETFTRCYRAHMDKLMHAKLTKSLFCLSGGDRRRHGLNMLYQMVCRKFPSVPSKCLFIGMFATGAASPGAAAAQPNRSPHITRAKFDRLITGTISEIFELITRVGKGGPEVDMALDKAHQLVQHFRNCRDVQFSRYMPLLSAKVQQLVDTLAGGRELKNSPHCALLLSSLDLITGALRNNLGGTDDDDDGGDTARGKADWDNDGTPSPPLIQTATIALQSLLRLLQQNRRTRQIQPLCEKVCNAVVQLLKFDGAAGESKRRRRRLSDRANSTGQLLGSYGVLLGELADWKALNVPDRAILKRTVMNMAAAAN